jgi:hypothetical protein
MVRVSRVSMCGGWVGGVGSWEESAPFETGVLPSEADAASEELDDLGAFAFPYVEEAHIGDAVAVPAFDELLRT